MATLAVIALAATVAAAAACGGTVNDESRDAGSGASPFDAATLDAAALDASKGIAPRDAGSFAPSDAGAVVLGVPPRLDASLSQCGDFVAARSSFAAYAAAGLVGAYSVIDVAEECSGAGGVHVTFELQTSCFRSSPAPRIVRYGGHACVTAKAWQVGEVAVLGVDPGAPLPSPSGWCVDALPKADGVARLYVSSSSSAVDSTLRDFGCAIPLGGR